MTNVRYDRVALSRVFTGRTTSWMFTSYLIGRWRRERCNAGKWSSTFVRVSKWCRYSSALHESKHEICYLCPHEWRRNKWKTKKETWTKNFFTSSSEKVKKKSRSQDFFLERKRDFSLFYASSRCTVCSNKFPLCFLPWLFPFFFFFLMLLKNIYRPEFDQYRIGSLVADTGLSSNSANVDRPRPQCPPT